jgi:hypothetical protein
LIGEIDKIFWGQGGHGTRWRAGVTDFEFIWDDESGGNVEHIAANDLTPEDVINAYETVTEFAFSRSSDRPAFYGCALDGRRIFVVYDEIDETASIRCDSSCAARRSRATSRALSAAPWSRACPTWR